jgi:hypothetical protein
MKVFFTCSTRFIEKYATFYKATRDEILRLGHKLSRDWIDYSINVAQRGLPDIPSHTLYKDVMSAIVVADVVVIDATVRSMPLGHQLTYALQKGKPVLVLRYKEKGEELDKLFIEGSEMKDLLVAEYKNIDDIKKQLQRFFKKYEDKSVRRFNLVITGAEDSYVNWAAFNYKRTKTEIIQEAIDRMMEKDPVYKKYLERQS